MYEVRGLSFSYQADGREVQVLRSLDLSVRRGEFVGIQGPSGSGKSTLFYILGFLLSPMAGSVFFEGRDIGKMTTDEATLLRNARIGFVFQQFHLLPKANVLENILLPSRYPSEIAKPGEAQLERAKSLARELGIDTHLRHLPNQLSGGQQQRVAIARALMNDVDLILADEPTGNLDSGNARQTLDLLTELNRRGKTIILITHDSDVARRCSRVHHMKDGVFVRTEENFAPALLPEGATSAPRQAALPGKYSLSVYANIGASLLPLVTENLSRNRAKSLLTMLGVVIGVGAVLAMVTLGQFTQQKILQSYENMGVNKLMVRGYRNWNLHAEDQVAVNFSGFDWDKDLLSLRRVFPQISLMSPVLKRSDLRAAAGGLQIEDKVTALGVNAQYLAITNRELEAGRAITPFHIESRSPVCVVGYQVAQRLFSDVNPLGQIVTITDGQRLDFPCEVIGVLAQKSSNKDWAPPDLNVLIPYSYYQIVADSWWSRQIHEVALRIDASSRIEDTGKAMKALFEQKYGKSGEFVVDTDSTMIAEMKKFLNIFSILLAAIALLSLVVGGIGINNMMLVSVAERLKEFGIRKALGATHFSIRMQVLLESVILCAIAGLVGLLLGFSAYELLIFGATKVVPGLKFEWIFDTGAAFLSAVSIVVVGIASGFVPALKAEKLQVIEALRSE